MSGIIHGKIICVRLSTVRLYEWYCSLRDNMIGMIRAY